MDDEHRTDGVIEGAGAGRDGEVADADATDEVGSGPDTPAAFVRDHGDDAVGLTLDLVAIDTRNPPGETRAAAAFVREYLEDLGIETETIAVDPARPNLVARIPGASDRTLLFNGHLDTVPFDADEWAHDPLGERDGDRVYGRGTTDMKGAVAAMLLAARAHVEAGPPPVDLTFAFVSDEETGGAAGLDVVLDDLAADGCVIGETTCERGRHSVTVADRGSIWLTLEATGVAAHGSRPMTGVNAIDRLYDAVEHVRSSLASRPLPIDPAIEAVVEESAAYYEPIVGPEAARDLFAYPSVNLGTLTGGEAVNTVPETARAELDVRLTAGVPTPDVLSDVRACLTEHEGVRIVGDSWSVGTYTDPESPVAAAAVDVAEAVTGDRVFRRSATGGGDAKTLRNAGIPTVEFGLGTDTAHAVDEYTTVEAIRGNALVYARLPEAFAARL